MEDDLDKAKQQNHARLASEHSRLAEFHETHAGGISSNAGSSPSIGSQTGDFMSAVLSHKWIIIGGIILAIVLFVVIIPSLQTGANVNGSNQFPNYSSSVGVVPSSLQASIDNLNAQIASLESQQLNAPVSNTPNQPNLNNNPDIGFINCPLGQAFSKTTNSCQPINLVGDPIQGPNPPNPVNQPPNNVMRFITVTKFPSPNGTLSGIAQSAGITLSRIEQLNPQISNTNVIHVGDKVRIS